MEYSEKLCDNLAERLKKEKRETVNFFALILFLIFLTVAVIHLNFFVFMNIEVSGSSMQSTLYSGDNLIAIRNASVSRGDIIIINKNTHSSSESGYYLIKRAIGIGGDTVEIKEDGKVYLNGEKLEESYLDDFQITKIYDSATGRCDTTGYSKWELSDDEIFYLGDNRLNSADARVNGACKKSDVIGVVSDFSVRHKETLTAVFKFFRSILEWFNKTFGGGE